MSFSLKERKESLDKILSSWDNVLKENTRIIEELEKRKDEDR